MPLRRAPWGRWAAPGLSRARTKNHNLECRLAVVIVIVISVTIFVTVAVASNIDLLDVEMIGNVLREADFGIRIRVYRPEMQSVRPRIEGRKEHIQSIVYCR